ncbi:zinc finger, CCHC-type containing protein [Tanacetum coccineum]
MKVDGTVENFKARLVIQGFRQKSEIDYFDTYALVARISTIRLLIDLELIHNLIIYQMDVKTTFLNSELDEEVYINNLGASLCLAMKISTPMDTSENLRPNNVGKLRSGYHQKDRKPSQNDKTEHGMEKTVRNQGQSPKMPKSESILKNQQSNRSQN